MNDIYIYAIVALLPLSACMLVSQSNPFHALVIRGIFGAVAALVYALLGAADVALTEALMGTLLSITLYAIAVRSSMVMRLGILENSDSDRELEEPIEQLRGIVAKKYLRLELVPYENTQALHQALEDKDIHAICVKSERKKDSDRESIATAEKIATYQTIIRIPRLYEIIHQELRSETILKSSENSLKIPSKLAEQHQ